MSLCDPETMMQAGESSVNITLLSVSVNSGPGITTRTESPADNLPGLLRQFVGDLFHDLVQ